MKEVQISFQSKGDTLYLVSSKEAVDFLNGSIESGFIGSLHLVNSDGLFKTLLESCMKNSLGFDITSDEESSVEEFLNGRSRYLAVISVNAGQENDFVDYMFNHGVSVTLLGHTTKGELRVDDVSYGFIGDFANRQ